MTYTIICENTIVIGNKLSVKDNLLTLYKNEQEVIAFSGTFETRVLYSDTLYPELEITLP